MFYFISLNVGCCNDSLLTLLIAIFLFFFDSYIKGPTYIPRNLASTLLVKATRLLKATHAVNLLAKAWVVREISGLTTVHLLSLLLRFGRENTLELACLKLSEHREWALIMSLLICSFNFLTRMHLNLTSDGLIRADDRAFKVIDSLLIKILLVVVRGIPSKYAMFAVVQILRETQIKGMVVHSEEIIAVILSIHRRQYV